MSSVARALRKLTGNAAPNAPTSSPGWNMQETFRRTFVEVDENGNMKVYPIFIGDPAGGSPAVNQAGNTDGISAQHVGITTNAQNTLWNGVTWDRQRENIQIATVNDATTTTYTGPDINTYNARSILVELDVSSLTTTGGYALEVDWKAQDGTYRSLWTQATAKSSAVNQTVIIGMGSAGYVITAGVNGSTAGIAGRSQADSAGAAQLGYAPVPIPPIIRVLVTKTNVTVYAAKVDVVLQN